jgi:predicted N-formylglutamate amidohydrolase
MQLADHIVCAGRRPECGDDFYIAVASHTGRVPRAGYGMGGATCVIANSLAMLIIEFTSAGNSHTAKSKGVQSMTYNAFHVHGADRSSRWLVTCDHATNTVPAAVGGGDLGLPAADMARHIAYDVGALGLSQFLGAALDAPVVASNFSRLVIDPNRGEDDPTLLMKLYDGTLIPANRHADAAEVERRLNLCHRPYHEALAPFAARDRAVLLSMHSFTPQLRGRPPRPWQIGVLYAGDDRLARPLIDRLRAEPDLTVGDNEPYTGHLPGDAVDRHALRHGRPNVLIEVRNDLIEDEAGQREWSARLAPILEEVLESTNL